MQLSTDSTLQCGKTTVPVTETVTDLLEEMIDPQEEIEVDLQLEMATRTEVTEEGKLAHLHPRMNAVANSFQDRG